MDLDLAQLAGQAIVTGFDGTSPSSDLLDELGAGRLGGAILFGRNIGDVIGVADCVRAIAGACPAHLPPFVAVDQEGGRVQRLGPPVLQLPPMRRLGELDDVELTKRTAGALARGLRALGFNLDFAPVMDVDSNPRNPIIGDRAFGRDPRVVARHGVAMIEGLQSHGVLACAKHFPGHGDTLLDSHLALPRVEHPRERLNALELPPFRAAVGAGVAAVMTAHVVYDGLDPGVPATLSRAIVGSLLRAEMAFEGIIVSDDLEMKAIADGMGMGEAGVAAIEAGCDVLLVCSNVSRALAVREALVARAERDARLAERLRQSAHRSLRVRGLAPPHPLAQPLELLAALNHASIAAVRDELGARLAEGQPRA